jgi:assimilatory nitrate reductase catalytic subunit
VVSTTRSTTGSPGSTTGSPGANGGNPGATIERAGPRAAAPSPAGVATHCPYCSLQCGMRLTGRRTPEVAAWQEFPVNEGALCRKGWTATGLVGHRERLATPLLRDRATGEFRQASWDEALDVVAARLVTLRDEHGADSVAVFGGGGLTNEKAYQLGKFARVALGTSQIDYNGRWCMSSAATAANRAFGLDRGLPFPLADLERTDVLVLVGSNLAETMPPAARHLDALRERGGRVVVIDPRRTPTADRADVVVQPVPGTDLALALGVLHLLVANGDVDEEYVAARTSGFDEVRRSVAAWWPERVERVTGVPVAELHELATLLGKAPRVMVLTARGAEQHSQGTDTVLAWINVALALGQCGREHAGYGCLTGQGNGQGGREHGQKADQLPGYRMIDDPAAREHVAGVWGVPPESLPGKGRSAYELLEALGTDTGSRALLVFGSNVVVSAPNATHVTERLAALDLLVVADIVLSETAALADVVLPVTQFAEETGTMTNLEGRVILRQRAITPPAGVRSDLDVLEGLARRLGSPVPFSTDPEEVFAELGRATRGGKADYSGITYDRIRAEHGVFWPCPEVVSTSSTSEGSSTSENRSTGESIEAPHPGTPRMFLDRFATPDGRARFHAVAHRGAAEQPCDDYPVHLTTGRVLAQYQSGAQTRRVRGLPDEGSFVELHPMLAGRIGAVDGGPVRVSTRRGTMTAVARVVATIRPDTVFVPFHWVGANRLTNDALDPSSRMPEFKVCAARVAAVPAGGGRR